MEWRSPIAEVPHGMELMTSSWGLVGVDLRVTVPQLESKREKKI